MRNRIMRAMARWYYRSMYKPQRLSWADIGTYPDEHHLKTVPWISIRETLCQSTALQMIAAHWGIERPRRHFDFLMGFTYGASYRSEIGFSTIGVDPETGLRIAAPLLGLALRYLAADDPDLYLAALRSQLAQDRPLRAPLDMGALHEQREPLPHNEVLVGYDDGGFYYYEPVCRPPANCQPGQLPAGAPGLYVPFERLLRAVDSQSQLFGYPWRCPFILLEPGPRQESLNPVWRQNGQALMGGRRWGQLWGSVAIEHTAAEIERWGDHFDPSQIELGLELGAVTRPDNALYLRESFADKPELLRVAEYFDQAANCYRSSMSMIAERGWDLEMARQTANWLRDAARLEWAAGEIFLLQAD